MKRLLALLGSLVLLPAAWADSDTSLDADESVMFFPTIAQARPDGSISLPVSAWVFEEESEKLLTAALTTYIGVDLAKHPPWQQALFNKRARYFRTDSERGERIRVRVGEQVFALPPTDAAGRAIGEFVVGREQVVGRGKGVGIVAYALEAPGHAQHGIEGKAWVLPAEGTFVVSDIDDTIKESSVLDRKALLRNTFLEPFKAVPGMADWYREMAVKGVGVFFHYLSASPLELFPALSEFLSEQGFPEGVLHLRESTAWRDLYANQEDNKAHKLGVLDRLAAAFPQRKFILVGDSGESDPEIYGRFAREHPGRIVAIHIRDVTGEKPDSPRYRNAFARLPAGLWKLR